MKKKILISAILAVAYGWVWLTSWWITHLSTEPWISFGQIFTMAIVCFALMLDFIAVME